MRTCTKCENAYPLTGFYRKSQNRVGYNSWCKRCVSQDNTRRQQDGRYDVRRKAYHRGYYKRNKIRLVKQGAIWKSANKEKIKLWFLNWRLNREYGISYDEYLQKIEEQKGKCPICDTMMVPQSYGHAFTKRTAVVDHDHTSKKLRKILCNSCNSAIGKLYDNPILLEKAAAYLREFQ
jgi:hypothetical protein